MTLISDKISTRNLIYKIIIAFVTVTLIVLMFPKGESIESEVTEGSIWLKDDLIASFSFPIIKSVETYQSELRAAEESVFPVFIQDPEVGNISLDSLKEYSNFLLELIDYNLSNDTLEILNTSFLSAGSFTRFQSIRIRERNLITTLEPKLRDLFSVTGFVLNKTYKKGILSINADDEINDSIAIRVGNIDKIEPISNYLFLDQSIEEIQKAIGRFNYPEETQDAVVEFSSHFLFPNLVFSSRLTNEEIEQVRNNVSKYSGIVNENERIIAKHDRVSRETILKIESYKEAKGDSAADEGIIFQLIGKYLHIILLFSLLTVYLMYFRKKIFYDNDKLVLISIIILFISFVTFLVNQIVVEVPIHFLIFVPAASMLFTIIFDSRVGFYNTVILSLVVGALRANDYTFVAMNIIAGGLSVYTVRDIKNRSQIFRSFLIILIGYTVSIIAFGLERFAPFDKMLIEFAFAGSNALISPVLTYGLLIFFEKFFNITTDLTLLELSNYDRPLLKELARTAPGTFNHSVTMGTMAENAAERIDANPLLARVGSYYHDIGKTIIPQNFVENQLNNQNVHENLTPEESAELIANHVKEGIRLAEDNNLPQEIIDFIPMHHGTSVMTYFYERAKKLYGDDKVKLEDYKYPGPKPNTKETAIIMLADGCESAVRSISDPDSEKVENVINGIFKSRIDDGQLENSPITYSDITKLKEAFISILIGQHHRRIRYPKQEEMEKGVDEDKEE
jgi:putative nucleotidyltransferase with HDIG domain